MNNLIQKAIQAISEGKNEYAVGLLEGVMAMLPDGTAKTPTQTISSVLNAPIKSTEVKTEVVEPIQAMEQAVAGKLGALKASSITQ